MYLQKTMSNISVLMRIALRESGSKTQEIRQPSGAQKSDTATWESMGSLLPVLAHPPVLHDLLPKGIPSVMTSLCRKWRAEDPRSFHCQGPKQPLWLPGTPEVFASVFAYTCLSSWSYQESMLLVPQSRSQGCNPNHSGPGPAHVHPIPSVVRYKVGGH